MNKFNHYVVGGGESQTSENIDKTRCDAVPEIEIFSVNKSLIKAFSKEGMIVVKWIL